MIRVGIIFGFILALFGGISPLAAQSDYTLEPFVDGGLNRPLFMTQLDDGRFFIVEQDGRILVMVDGEILASPFLDITDVVSTAGNEEGLLGLAFHPEFAENGYFYAYYTRQIGRTRDSVVARFRIYDGDPNRAIASSRTEIFTIGQPFRNHNGGMITFGPDGYLYVALGDGGNRDDPNNNGQNPDTLLGSIIRIDVDNPADGQRYGIPADNPFVDGGGAPEIWVWGLRNPWRFSFDRSTGDMFIGDVGQRQWEEIDIVSAGDSGLNFGWNAFEGSNDYVGTANGDTVLPIAEYSHEEGCSVTGGYMYRGDALPELNGTYLYADFCEGTIWSLTQSGDGEWESELFMDTDYRITSFAEDLAGELYVIDRRGGIYKLVNAQ